MKTLHLTNAWHEKSGGISTFYRALIAAANRNQQEIRLVVPGSADRVEEVGEFARIYHVAGPRAWLNSNYRIIFPSQFVTKGSRLQNILAFERPDLIGICDKYTLHYLGPLLRMRLLPAIDFRPVIVGVSQERMDDNVRAYFGSIPFARKFCALYMRWLYFPFFDHHIVNSEYTAQELHAASQGHMVPRSTWIRPMGVDLEYFSPQRRRPDHRRRLLQNFGVSDDATLLLYAGRLVPEKNLGLLFDLASHLARHSRRDYRLLVVGDGIEREHWERKMLRELAGRVVFFGHIVEKDVLADLYANCDVFVHPNPREPFGIAPLEAMASGLPLVAPDSGGVISYANMRNAWTVNADVESFARAIEEVMANPSLAADKTAAALATAQEYRWDRVAQSYLELYAQLGEIHANSGSVTNAAFSSTQATGVQLALMRGVSVAAQGGFKVWTKLTSGPRSRRRPMAANPAEPS